MNQPNEVAVWSSGTGLNINTSTGTLTFSSKQATVDWLVKNGALPAEAADTVERAIVRGPKPTESR